MNRKIFLHAITLILLGISSNLFAKILPTEGHEGLPRRAPMGKDTIPLRDRSGDYLRDSVTNPFNLRDPAIIEKSVEYDPLSNRYIITEKIGDEYYRTPMSMTFEEYGRWKAKQQEKEYFERLAGLNKKRNGEAIDPLSKVDFSATQNNKLKMLLKSVGTNGKLPEVPKVDVKKMGDNLIGMIFGDPPTVDIRPQGQIDLTLGGDYRYFGNPVLPTYARTTGGLLFNMDIQMNVTGKIGEKLNLNTSFNNKATFDFDNIMKLNYNSNVWGEDDIIKSIEGGNVNLPLRGTLIQGSQNLFTFDGFGCTAAESSSEPFDFGW
jgi:cell surface protein SprA